MNCEICGKLIENLTTIEIDGTQFDVCESCSSLGKKLEVEEEKFERKPQIQRTQKSFSQTDLKETALIEEFGKKIMQARQRKGLKLKDLALKMYEKESVIQRIESEKFIPSEKTIRKLEKELEISLRE